MSDIREHVRERYADAARVVTRQATSTSCCDSSCGCEGDAVFGSSLYDEAARKELPDAAVLASLGCGNPIAVADLCEGETVLDLGSGGGIDVLLSAKRVGASGKAYGLDMTEEMLELARKNAKDAGVANAEFLKGYIEDIPLPRESVDVVISNCVVNLSPDKPRVLAEVFRVLAPGGRVGITDVVADDALTEAERAERGSYTGCIAGALSIGEYERLLTDAGFSEVSVTRTHDVADRMYSAIVKARKTG
jgi:arsenite methyltransferase